MIEAVNSVLSNASSTRGAVEQQSTVRSFAANPEKIQEAARPSVSRRISIDNSIEKAILEIRDNNTGNVVRQFPTEGQLKAYRTAQQFASSREASQVSIESPSINVSSSAEVSAAPTQSAPIQAPVAPDVSVAAPTTSTTTTRVETEA